MDTSYSIMPAYRARRYNTLFYWFVVALVVIGIIGILGLVFGSIAFSSTHSEKKQEGGPVTKESNGLYYWNWSEEEKTLSSVDSPNIVVRQKSVGPKNGGTHEVVALGSEEEEELGYIGFGDSETGEKTAGLTLSKIPIEEGPILTIDFPGSKVNASVPKNVSVLANDNGPPDCPRDPPFRVKQRNDECPRGFVGINKRNPVCNLDVVGTVCIAGNVTINGTLFVTDIVGVNVSAVQCLDASACNDSDPCTDDACVDGFCKNTVPDGTCNADHFCTSNERCELVGDNACSCVNTCTPFLCNMDPCSPSTCVDGECVLLHNISNCCTLDAQCNDTDPCTDDACVDGLCQFTVPEGKCNADHLCTSNEACLVTGDTPCTCRKICTQASCNTFPCEVRACVDGVCTLLHRDVGCCKDATDCFDNNVCTADICGGNNQCLNFPVNGTCAHDADCPAGKICLSNCSCASFTPGKGECLESFECADNCRCTLDQCNKLCACENTPFPNCCKNNTDCEDNNPCHTAEICDTETGLCSFTIKDDDEDGVPCDIDCDDSNNAIGVAITWFRDEDGDGDGNQAITQVSCDQPSGFVATGTDCDDSNPLVFAGSQVCNLTDLQNQFKLLPDEDDRREGSEFFGLSVSLHRNTALVGAPARDDGTDGIVFVFVRAFDGIWVQQQRLGLGKPGPPTFFGLAVANYGELAAVGGNPFVDVSEVSVFERDGMGTWNLNDTLFSLPVDNVTNGFGTAIDMHGERIVVGAPLNGVNVTTLEVGAGAVFHFERNQTTLRWSDFAAIIEAPDGARGDNFGASLALDTIDGELLAVGAPSVANETGRVYLYTWNGTAFVFLESIVAPNGREGDLFGNSVDVEDGVVVVGSPRSSPSEIAGAGSVYIFKDTGAGFVQIQQLVSPDRHPLDNCGFSVAISNETIAIGCPRDTLPLDTFEADGTVNVWKRIGARYEWVGKMHPFDSNTVFGFGFSVGIFENTIISGAPNSFVLPPFNGTTLDNADGAAYISNCELLPTC